MRIGHAIYGVPTLKRHSDAPRTERGTPERGAAPPSASHSAYRTDTDSETVIEQPELRTLGEMLHEHFINEVRRRDHDKDGRLNRTEYGGSIDEFASLDWNRDGLIDAHDLVRGVLERNDSLRDLVSGEWSPIFNALLQVRYPDTGELAAAIHEGAARVIAAQADRASEADDAGSGSGSVSASAQSVEDVTLDFLANHGDLRSLHARLQDLADRLGRNRRYAPIDRLA